MGDISDSPSGDGAAGRGWLARSWLGRHWRGELPLAKAFWLNGCLLNLAIEVLGGAIALPKVGIDYSLLGDLLVLDVCAALAGMTLYFFLSDVPPFIFLAVVAVVRMWQIVGIARSADRYPGWRPGEGRKWNGASRRLFAFAARAVMAVWVAALVGMWIVLAVGPSNQ